MRRVVITGIGAITPIGNTFATFREALKNGISGANKITLFDASQFKTHFACEVDDFESDDRMLKRNLYNGSIPAAV